jgi:OPT family small oligopeptide transporter
MAKTPSSKTTLVEVEEIPMEDVGNRWDPDLSDKESPPSNDEEKYQLNNIKREEENSPFEEVRSAVPNYDQDVPANTIRAWTMGIICSIVGSAMNTLFSMRNPPIGISTIIALLLCFPIGKAWARALPNRQFNTFGLKWNLNPGPFNVKEHTVIVVMASVSFGTAYATDIILAQNAFYKRDYGLLFQLLLITTTQCVGYGIAGILRKVLVYPAAMIWPANLVSVTLLHAMHEKKEEHDPTDMPRIVGGKMSRYRWFGYVFLASFLWYFIPGYLAQFLSIFAFITWIYPQSPVINQLFGGTTGLSLIPITFDWTQVSGYVGNPMIPPWNAIANTLIGIVLFNIIGASALHYGGAWYSKWLPISDSSIYDNTGSPYNVTRLVNKQFMLDVQSYKEYSPLFISTTFAIAYGLSFATIASLISHTWIHYRQQIVAQLKSSRAEKPDIHMKLMLRYPEVPMIWYGTLFLIMVVLSLVIALHWETELTWWALLFAVTFSTVMSLPIGIVQAITNQQIGLNVITELIMGYMQPGKPLALMMFKTYGYITASQALFFVSDIKL